MKKSNDNIKKYLKSSLGALVMFLLLFSSCEQFVEVELPKDQITGEAVFQDKGTVEATLRHVYSELRDNALTTGKSYGVSYLMGHYADELHFVDPSLSSTSYFEENNVLPTDDFVKRFWDKGYGLVYAVNRVIEGVENNPNGLEEDKDRFLGEAYFLRAYLHFYLVNLFGPIPYIDTTDYHTNTIVSRQPESEVYQRSVEDLLKAKELLPVHDGSEDRARPDRWTAVALLARTYLFQKDWAKAAQEAGQLIVEGNFELGQQVQDVFRKGNRETIWQLTPNMEGWNTHEGLTYIVDEPLPDTELTQGLLESFEEGDARRIHWVGSVTDGENFWYFPMKYREGSNTEVTQECSVLFRLGELYLIAAEAQAAMGNGSESLHYLNAIRERALLPPLEVTVTDVLMEAIMAERRVELFTEHGHRFFDLKRKGLANPVLSSIKPNWDSTDILLPLPEAELSINPNLLPQNEGY